MAEWIRRHFGSLFGKKGEGTDAAAVSGKDPEKMFLIAGLGNPGNKYQGTRHNVGFDVVDLLIEKHHIPQSGVKFNAMYGKGMIGDQKVVLMKPLSFMNLSGGPIQQMAAFFKINPETELIVIHDDIDLSPGQLRIRTCGSAGGHNGMKDIVKRLGTEKFMRIRVGVGAKPEGWDLADYVLSRFSEADRKLIDEALKDAAAAAETIVTKDINTAMNSFNRKKTG